MTEILEMILKQIALTGSVTAGYDKVMGEGAYEKLAGEVWAQLQA